MYSPTLVQYKQSIIDAAFLSRIHSHHYLKTLTLNPRPHVSFLDALGSTPSGRHVPSNCVRTLRTLRTLRTRALRYVPSQLLLGTREGQIPNPCPRTNWRIDEATLLAGWSVNFARFTHLNSHTIRRASFATTNRTGLVDQLAPDKSSLRTSCRAALSRATIYHVEKVNM